MLVHEVADRFAKMRQPRVILKLDMAKAFDRVDWDYLESMMTEMGFGRRWLKWIRSCVSNANYSLLVNGGTFGYFGGTRGLRQGDPLSPLLFNIVGEGFTSIIKAALEVGWLRNTLPEEMLPVAQFADDTIVFGEGLVEQIEKWKAAIKLFELASGQRVNWDKTELFGFNLSPETTQLMADMLGCNVGSLPSTYLGLPLFHSRIIQSIWSPVMEKVHKHLSLWKGKLLSTAGRLILIKACLYGIPAHYLSFMHCPVSVAKELERLFRRFLWRGSSEDFKYHLVNWKKVCLPKDMGGLGIRKVSAVNKAFMLKWCWRLNIDKKIPWSKLVELTSGGR
ncbi:hypothetical protein H6P81_015702 [Aristolochia fimbriata]|uniref:Reverse transcriptase domain-containing protein n=1 Tax=Aristolochia fimbriata TaxID=158543 RepID=A0AAV7E9F0_ARIFI|nr:hypothetical protein H6P81_015702 [Aristolochia fimbriata]